MLEYFLAGILVTVMTVMLVNFVRFNFGYNPFKVRDGDRYIFKSELSGLSYNYSYVDGSGKNLHGMIRFMEQRLRSAPHHKRGWTFWIFDTKTSEIVWHSDNM